jgi:hypothetical protein
MIRQRVRIIAALVGFLGVTDFAEVATINSAPKTDNTVVIEGVDTSLRTTHGYDNVTGLGTPNIPAIIDAVPHPDTCGPQKRDQVIESVDRRETIAKC